MIAGLTSSEVNERINQGLINRAKQSNWADYRVIISRHLFTIFNLMVVPAAIALFLLREPQAGIAVSGMAIVNTVIGMFQELRAKRHLDQLAILVETRARVIRDGQIREIPASEVVLGEFIQIRAGDAVVADGTVVEATFLEVDEALLTGEADPVRRDPGAPLLSGSICVAGQGCYRADKIGSAAYAAALASAARRYHSSSSPMTRVINRIIEVLTFTAVVLCGLYFILYALEKIDADRLVLMIAATITSMVPQGLVLTATVAFIVGALLMSKRGALVQRLNAVEAMASIDVICSDKTGTLTTNHLRLVELRILAESENEVKRRLALFASGSVDRQNPNIQALLAALGEVPVEPLDQVPFKSQNRYSAIRIADSGQQRVLVMGAPEGILAPAGQWSVAGATSEKEILELQQQGLRILLFAELNSPPERTSLAELPRPAPLQLLAIIGLGDELRPDAAGVIQALTSQGIRFKVVSGDNPETVRATVRGAGIAAETDPVISGQEIESAAQWLEEVGKHSIFGRVAPGQKVEIVEALQHQNHRVAMIGDGVNDVLALKRSDLGIAMGAGSQAAKTVSGLVLENNCFALLPETIEEGRTIVRNVRRAAKIFLVKNVYSLVMILVYASGVAAIPFPYRPQQVTLLNWLVIGIPALLIAFMKERSTTVARSVFLREVGWFALRTGLLFGLAGVTILVLAKHLWDFDERTQRTMLLSTLILLGITALFRALKDGEGQGLRGDNRLRWLAAGALPVYLLAMYWPLSAKFFELAFLNGWQWLYVLATASVTCAATLLSDRIGRLRPDGEQTQA
jgi:cation-transporting P-type ATPase E